MDGAYGRYDEENELWFISPNNVPEFISKSEGPCNQESGIYDVKNNIIYHSSAGANRRYVFSNFRQNGVVSIAKFETIAYGMPTIYKITRMTERFKKLPYTIKNLYIDKCSGNLPEEVFKSMMEDFLKEQGNLENQIPQLHDELEQISTATDEVNEWLSLISDFTNIETLTRAVVCELIESITVSDRQKVDGKWEQSIDIRYRFIGDLLQDEETGVKKRTLISS